jgi:AsmA family/AsmA-like C-terminal region
VRFFRSKRGRGVALVVLVLALFLVRPGVGRLRARIVSSLSLALGRPVDIAYVSLRVLPRPGFDLENVVIHEDPAFGAEPMLHADAVTAALRLSSLLRGHLEIARLSFTEPSLNLVQNGTGHWNMENLLQRADNIPIAPTSKAKSEKRPGFPYIEADHARINFKLGQEKKPYALTNANFSLWQDSENTWGMRLRADPVRTDFNLSDTGTVRVEGSWQRSSSLRETPLQLSLQWQGAQLGQVSKLAVGRDPGWRGEIAAMATLKGTPARVNIDSDVTIDDFRRYDLAQGGPLRLAAHCSALYSSVTRSFPNLFCRGPVGGGFVAVEGNVGGWSELRTYDLALRAQSVPAQSLVALLRRAKKGIPADLSAAGVLEGSFRFQRASHGTEMNWSGTGVTRGLRLQSTLAKADVLLDRIPFTLSAGRESSSATEAGGELARLDLGPFAMAMGRPVPALVQGELSGAGYNLGIRGEVQIQHVLQLARILGLPSAQPAADGIAKVDLQVAGMWSAFAGPQTSGKAQLRSIRAEVHGLNQPLEIASANVFLTPSEATVKNISASLAGSAWHGSVVVPRQCAASDGCPIRFDLHAETIATDELAALLSTRTPGGPWYRFLSSAPAPSVPYLRGLRASGKLSASQVTIHKLQASWVAANVDLEDGQLRLSDLRADILGGKHAGEWTADFTSRPPSYSGIGTFTKIALPQLAAAMHDGWITGSADGSYHATASGWSMPDLLSSANATLEVSAFDGTLPHVMLAAGSEPLAMRHFDGLWLLRNGRFEIQEGKLDTPSGIYQVSGTASLGRVLNLKLTRNGVPGFEITGTITQPHVAANSAETQAALKP